MHKRLATVNLKATFVNCDKHTFNLVDVHAASHEAAGVTFLSTVQAINIYFSRSSLQWERLKITLGMSVKSELETHWSARL